MADTTMTNGTHTAHQGGTEGQPHQTNSNNNINTNNTFSHSGSSLQYVPNQTSSSSAPAATAGTQPSEIPKDEVGWYFVEQYYTTLSRNPEKLYLFYNKRSQFVSGQETDKVAVCVGQRAINDKIKELEFSDCKVRVTNVDSQASDSNIVIQVIGEISNKSQPHKKFVQTFVLATQTNGYFVLNDIFRYLIEEEDEPEQGSSTQLEETNPISSTAGTTAVAAAVQEPAAPTEVDTTGPATAQQETQAIDLETEDKTAKVEEPTEAVEPATTNGVSEVTETKADDVETTSTSHTADDSKVEAPVSSGPAIETPEPKQAPSAPASAPQAPSAKPAPKSWASLAASANRVAMPVAPAAASGPAVAATAAPAAAQQPPTRPAAAVVPKSGPPQAPSGPAQATSTPPAVAAVQRDDSPASSQQDEWTSVDRNHSRQQSRQVNHQQEPAQNRGYIKNVFEPVDAGELRRHLEQFGDLFYFDVNRAKNCAFVDFKSPDGYAAAVAANPHVIGSEKLFVEERRIRAGTTPFIPGQRGGFPGNRGGRGGANQGPPRGGFQGGRGGANLPPRGGRGGAPNAVSPIRGGRGGAQGA